MTNVDAPKELHCGWGAKGLLHALPPGYENASGNKTQTPSLCGAFVGMWPTSTHVHFSFGQYVEMCQRRSMGPTYGLMRHPRPRRAMRTPSLDRRICRRCRKHVRLMAHPRWSPALGMFTR